jgi:predicted outer membrane repeat protein
MDRWQFGGVVYREKKTMKTLDVRGVSGVEALSSRPARSAAAARKSLGAVMVRLGAAVLALLALVLVLGLALGMAAPVQAGGVVGNGNPASCTDAAYAAAMVGGGLVTFNCGPAPVTIGVTTQVITPAVTTTIDGGGLVTLDGGDTLQLFLVQNGGTLNLRNITLSRGRFLSGGAIYNSNGGTVDLYRVEIRQSVAEGTSSGSGGGAIFSQGTLRVDRSVFRQNQARNTTNPPRWGGALLIAGGTAMVRGATFIDNNANNGGAIYLPSGTLILENVSLINNVAHTYGLPPGTAGEGGAIYTFGTLSITNSTFAGNIAKKGGGLFVAFSSNVSLLNVTMNVNRADTAGGIFRESGMSTVTLKNTIVANSRNQANTSDSFECDGFPVTTLGNNLISDAPGICFTAPQSSDKKSHQSPAQPVG